MITYAQAAFQTGDSRVQQEHVIAVRVDIIVMDMQQRTDVSDVSGMQVGSSTGGADGRGPGASPSTWKGHVRASRKIQST